MLEWNVVVTAHEHRYRHARRFLSPLGKCADTDFYNVLVMQVAQPLSFLDTLARELEAQPEYLPTLARVLPVSETFAYQSPEEFERKATQVVLGWRAQLGGSRFHVRMHRRGFKGRLSSQEEERFLDHALLEALAAQGAGGQIDFADPDWILALDTVGQRAGLSLWSREQLQRYPLLKLD
jgi:tRNA(Ser,Leu) C12 N-acetylase TAN1